MASDSRTGDSTVSLVLAVLGVILLVVLLNSCLGESTNSGGSGGSIASVKGAQPATPQPTATATPSATPTSTVLGRKVSVTMVEVLSVPADEGFWIGSGSDDRVWVELTGLPPESPYDVDKGDRVSFTGTVVKNATGFANRSGVTDAEGRRLLNAQGRHIDVDKGALRLYKRGY